jgi:hypothetical protein
LHAVSFSSLTFSFQREQQEDRRRARPTAEEQASTLSAAQYLEKLRESRERLSGEPGETIDDDPDGEFAMSKAALECRPQEELKRLLRYACTLCFFSEHMVLTSFFAISINGYLAENVPVKTMIRVIAEGQV